MKVAIETCKFLGIITRIFPGGTMIFKDRGRNYMKTWTWQVFHTFCAFYPKIYLYSPPKSFILPHSANKTVSLLTNHSELLGGRNYFNTRGVIFRKIYTPVFIGWSIKNTSTHPLFPILNPLAK